MMSAFEGGTVVPPMERMGASVEAGALDTVHRRDSQFRHGIGRLPGPRSPPRRRACNGLLQAWYCDQDDLQAFYQPTSASQINSSWRAHLT